MWELKKQYKRDPIERTYMYSHYFEIFIMDNFFIALKLLGRMIVER
jgi:hypothetical protein